jgi:hypothetical protein
MRSKTSHWIRLAGVSREVGRIHSDDEVTMMCEAIGSTCGV